jgi:hypothetical protein
MKKFIQTLKSKINKPLVTFLGAVTILVLVSNMETTTVEKAKNSVNKTVNKISKNLNSAANGEDYHTNNTTSTAPNSTTSAAPNNKYEQKLAIAEGSAVNATQKIIKSDNTDSLVNKNTTADSNKLSGNGQDLLKANISMN